jgi:hypothetical protein
MNAVSPKERTNIFLDRLSYPVGNSNVEKRDHRTRQARTHETTKAIHCARRLLGASYKRKVPSSISPLGCWIDFTNPSHECDSDVSDSENEDDDDILFMQESRWSSTPCLTSKLLLRESPKPLKKSASVDTAMTLPTRQRSYCDLKNLDL